jgi:hypothetical protein
VQNQTGSNKLKWDKSGVVVEAMPHHKYKVKMDGTGRVTIRNRIYLRPIMPYGSAGVQQQVRGPPGPLGVVNPQASPPAVLGGPTSGPLSSSTSTGSVVHNEREDLMEMPREPTEEEMMEELPADVRRGTRIRKKPELFVPGTWGAISGRSKGPGEIAGSLNRILGSRKWTPESALIQRTQLSEKVIRHVSLTSARIDAGRSRQLDRCKQLLLV